jgi:hypothetical protein
METKRKELYEMPSSLILEIKIEGMICESGGEEDRNNYGYRYDI